MASCLLKYQAPWSDAIIGGSCHLGAHSPGASMTVYRGYSDREDAVGGPENVVATVTNAGGTRPLPPLEDGFSWGYEGAGPRNLAAAILVDHLQLGPDYAGYLAEDAHFCL